MMIGGRRRNAARIGTANGLRRVIAASACMAALVSSAHHGHAADPATMIIVFDGSGSMWGKLDGEKQSKFVNAREALKPALSALKPDTRVGLMSYGHRRQADCSDTQVIVAPEGGAAERIQSTLEKLNPKGKGPVSSALREAAKALGKGPGKRSLILVHDDPDNCGIDACSVLEELQSSAPGLVVHAVGLGLKPDDTQKMQCLTRATNGKLIDARSAAQVSTGIEEIVRLASLDASPPAPVIAARPTPAIAAIAPPPKDKATGRIALATEGPSALRLATLLTGEVAPGQRPVRWSIVSETGGDVVMANGQEAIVPLRPGRYTVDVSDGLVEKRETVTVAAKGQTGLDVLLEGGLVRMPAPTQAASSDALVTISQSRSADASGERGRTLAVRQLSEIPPSWVLPPGKFSISFEQGGARWQQAVEVVAGAVVDLTNVRPFARLQVTINRPNTTGSARPILLIMVDDPDAPRGLREVARAAGSNGEFTLMAGTYAVIAKQGALEVRDRLALNAGDVVQRTLNLGGASLSLSSRLAGTTGAGATPADEPISYRISRIDVVPPQDYTSVQAAPQLDLPAGRYRIEARHGLINARTTRELDLAAGQRASVALEQQAGVVMLQPPANHQGEMFWQILDAQRRVIWGTAQSTPRATLQAGRYILRAETRSKAYERAFDIKAGQVLPLQLGE